jgi:hypothetical protein
MPNDRIKREWELFVEMAVPPDWGPTQRRAMRYAFYAGVSSMMGVMFSLGADGVTEDSGGAVLEEVDDELRDFARRAGAGEL